MQNSDIKKLIEDTIVGMGVSLDSIDIIDDSISQKKNFVIKTKESGLLIGENGETFQALSHLVRRMAEKIDQDVDFSIDINDYRSSMIDKLKLKAGILANRAKDMKSDVEMEPMSSYERLIVHGTLTGLPNIKTESIGEGRDRRVVIKYTEDLMI